MNGDEPGPGREEAPLPSDREIRRGRGIRIAGAGFLLVFLSGALTFIGSGLWAEIGTGIGFVLVVTGMVLVLRA